MSEYFKEIESATMDMVKGIIIEDDEVEVAKVNFDFSTLYNE